MPADTLTISLTGPLADDVRAAAAERGLTPEEFVRQQLEFDVALGTDLADLDIEEDLRRLEEPGEDVDAEVVFAEMRATLAKARSDKP